AADRKRLNSGVEGILLKNSFDPAHLVQTVRQAVSNARRKNKMPETASRRKFCTSKTTTTTCTCSKSSWNLLAHSNFSRPNTERSGVRRPELTSPISA